MNPKRSALALALFMGPETMTGAYLPGNRQVDLQQIPVPVPGHGEVLVRFKASTICGSDLRAIYHERPRSDRRRPQHRPGGGLASGS
jgi:threonine dehydrogenase-like Zn-dependent dehydrogenase